MSSLIPGAPLAPSSLAELFAATLKASRRMRGQSYLFEIGGHPVLCQFIGAGTFNFAFRTPEGDVFKVQKFEKEAKAELDRPDRLVRIMEVVAPHLEPKVLNVNVNGRVRPCFFSKFSPGVETSDDAQKALAVLDSYLTSDRIFFDAYALGNVFVEGSTRNVIDVGQLFREDSRTSRDFFSKSFDADAHKKGVEAWLRRIDRNHRASAPITIEVIIELGKEALDREGKEPLTLEKQSRLIVKAAKSAKSLIDQQPYRRREKAELKALFRRYADRDFLRQALIENGLKQLLSGALSQDFYEKKWSQMQEFLDSLDARSEKGARGAGAAAETKADEPEDRRRKFYSSLKRELTSLPDDVSESRAKNALAEWLLVYAIDAKSFVPHELDELITRLVSKMTPPGDKVAWIQEATLTIERMKPGSRKLPRHLVDLIADLSMDPSLKSERTTVMMEEEAGNIQEVLKSLFSEELTPKNWVARLRGVKFISDSVGLEDDFVEVIKHKLLPSVGESSIDQDALKQALLLFISPPRMLQVRDFASVSQEALAQAIEKVLMCPYFSSKEDLQTQLLNLITDDALRAETLQRVRDERVKYQGFVKIFEEIDRAFNVLSPQKLKELINSSTPEELSSQLLFGLQSSASFASGLRKQFQQDSRAGFSEVSVHMKLLSALPSEELSQTRKECEKRIFSFLEMFFPNILGIQSNPLERRQKILENFLFSKSGVSGLVYSCSQGERPCAEVLRENMQCYRDFLKSSGSAEAEIQRNMVDLLRQKLLGLLGWVRINLKGKAGSEKARLLGAVITQLGDSRDPAAIAKTIYQAERILSHKMLGFRSKGHYSEDYVKQKDEFGLIRTLFHETFKNVPGVRLIEDVRILKAKPKDLSVVEGVFAFKKYQKSHPSGGHEPTN